MTFSHFYFFRTICILISILYLSTVWGQQKEEVVPIVVPEAKTYSWVAQELPFWGVKVLFPEAPELKSNEIYTEKGLVPQKIYFWSDYRDELLLEASFYKLPEILNAKNEKKLIDNVANRIAVTHGGYPILSAGVLNAHQIKEFSLEIKTLKGASYKAKIFAESNQVFIVSSLLSKDDAERKSQAQYFLNSISFTPLPGEIKVEPGKHDPILTAANWEKILVDNFQIDFPRMPIQQHKVLKVGDKLQKYYEWYMGDGLTQTTYLFSLIPLENFEGKKVEELLQLGIQNSLLVTSGEMIQRRSLDYFKYPLEEIVFKTELQYFRVRYFCDGKYLYQLLVSGEKESIYLPDANRFLDGLKWID